jgi:hypothetical protein
MWAPLLTLAGVNIVLAWHFWGWLDEPGEITFRVAGVTFVLIEYCILVVASDNFARREYGRGAMMIVLGLALFVGGLIADFGAVVSRSSHDAQMRAQAVAAYDQAVVQEREHAAEAARLSAVLTDQSRDLPVAALQAQAARLAERRVAYDQEGLAPPQRLAESIARVDAALATAQARDAALARRDDARADLAAIGARPQADDPQSASIASLMGILGMTVAPADVRTFIGLFIAVLMKSLLFFGFWAMTPQKREQKPTEEEEAAAEQPEATTNAQDDAVSAFLAPKTGSAPETNAGPVATAPKPEAVKATGVREEGAPNNLSLGDALPPLTTYASPPKAHQPLSAAELRALQEAFDGD